MSKLEFKELLVEEIYAVLSEETRQHFREILSKVDESRMQQEIATVEPVIDLKHIWQSIRHLLLWDQTGRFSELLKGIKSSHISKISELEESERVVLVPVINYDECFYIPVDRDYENSSFALTPEGMEHKRKLEEKSSNLTV